MEIQVSRDNWTKKADTLVSGSAFLDGEYLSEERLADRISTIDGRSELNQFLSRINGFFSIIHNAGDEIYAAVDHVRSWPLFYAISDDLYISDSAEWVHENGARRGYDPVAGTEYLFTGFVSGKDTLSRDVKQIRAGELVTLYPDQSNSNVCRERYYSYNPSESSRTVDVSSMDEALVESVNRLIEYANDRTILLGLSGGYDSRLIALLLHRLGYEKVVAFTTHLAAGGSEEMPIARSIARDLGFEHVEITTDRSDFQTIEGSEQMELINEVGYLSEYPSINKVADRRKLIETGIDPSNVVLVLGHSLVGADGFLPERVLDQNFFSRDEFFDQIWSLQYSHWETPNEPRWRELFEGRILKRTPADIYRAGDIESTPEAIGGFEAWYWQERLPKYIVIRREYEQLGFDVWYPLLDRILCSFLENSNYRDRVGKRILKEYVRDLDVQIRGEKSDLAAGSDTSSRSTSELAWNQIVNLVHALPDPATQFIRHAYREYRSKDAYEQDPRYEIVPKNEFDSMTFPQVNRHELHRPLLLLYLYKEGFFDFPVETEFDRALQGSDS